LLFKDDKWSFITDDVKSLEGSFKGVETTFGYSLAFGRFSNTGNIFALVEFVYPETPAAVAGIERGDIIVKLNGNDITDENYRDLLYAPNVSLSFGIRGTDGISVDPKAVSLVAKELKLNPVLITDIVEHGDKKIGYLFYAQYIADFNSSLDEAFQYFMNEGITDLVVDLRYNPGGGTNAAQHFCSSIAPLSAVNNKETLVTFQWNDKYQEYFETRNNNSQLKVTFIDNIPVKMGLNSVYVLTGSGTASASELSITGLKPYMNVTTVGETTYGKYTASITMKPEDFYDNEAQYNDFINWGIQPIVLRYANSQGVTDFKEGFTPDIPVEDDLFSGIQLGEKEEPLFKAAIEDITGTPVVAMKKARIPVPGYTIFDRGFSKYDVNKRELLIEDFNSGSVHEIITGQI
jgi:carboxyl-terminal processing protease